MRETLDGGELVGARLRPLRYVPQLDGVRAVAVSMVVASHLLPGRFHGGAMGVDVFFALSGFLITTLLLDERLANREHVRLGSFYARRALRLFPALYTMVAVVLVVLVLTGHDLSDASVWRPMAGAATYTSNLPMIPGGEAIPVAHTWSLAVEEQFYLVWPLVLLTAFRFRMQRLLAVGLVAAVLAGFAFRASGPAHLSWVFGSRPESLAAGALFALALHESSNIRAWATRYARPAAWIAATLVLLWFGVTIVTLDWTLNTQFGFPFVGLLGAVLAASLAQMPADERLRGRLPRALAWPPVVRVGRLSYGIYLWHVPAIWVVNRQLRQEHWPARLVLIVLLTMAATEASYRIIEQPALRRSAHFRPKTDWQALPPATEPEPTGVGGEK